MIRKEQIESACKLARGRKRTDRFIRHLYRPKGFFPRPYETEQCFFSRLFPDY